MPVILCRGADPTASSFITVLSCHASTAGNIGVKSLFIRAPPNKNTNNKSRFFRVHNSLFFFLAHKCIGFIIDRLMLILQNQNQDDSSPISFLPSILRLSGPRVTCPTLAMPSTSLREHFSRESSCDSCEKQTIYRRRQASRTSSSGAQSPAPLSLQGFSDLFHSPASSPVSEPAKEEYSSDAERWQRMLALQREYHCYNSARLEAAVEALENGWPIEMVPIREYGPPSSS
jgi:hypothetical protein